MTQPVAPGARTACFDEPPAEPNQCTSPPPICTQVVDGFERAAARSPPPFEPLSAEPAGLRFCREADTVAEGFLCGERVVVSDACRKPNNSFDAYICDDPRMSKLDSNVWQATLWVIKSLVSQLVGRGRPR